MDNFFFDSSALVKRYIPEQGTAWVRNITQSKNPSYIVISELALVEMSSAIARRTREGVFTNTVASKLVDSIMSHATSRYYVLRLRQDVLINAQKLCLTHPIRSLDAIQLASALVVNLPIVRSGLSPLLFVSADLRLLAIAEMEGLQTMDVNGI